MIGESLTQFASQSLVMVAIGLIVYLVTKWLHIQYQGWSFAQPRNAAVWGLVAIFLGWILISVLFFTSASSPNPQPASDEIRQYTAGDVATQTLLALIAFGPALLAMRLRGEPCASAGMSAHNLSGSLLVGGLLAILAIAGTFFTGDGSLPPAGVRFTASHLWALGYYAVVGFGEEFAFRGYLQTRLMAWLGRWQGWLLASILMALAHIVQRITSLGMTPLEAFASSATLIPISLFLGFVMLRTENIVAPGLAHTFVNWVSTLV